MPRGIYIRTKEILKKQRAAHLGKLAWNKGLKRWWSSPAEFKKGHKTWNQYLLPIICGFCKNEFKPRERDTKYCSQECAWSFSKGRSSWNKGIPMSEETKKLLSNTRKGIRNNTGKTHFKKGDRPWNYKGGISQTPEYHAIYAKQHRARKQNAIGSHTTKEWEDLKKKYFNMCLCCKQFEPIIKLTEDHIIPLSLGGSDYIDNIQPLCASCNSRKNNKTINYIEGGYLIG